MKGDWLRDFDDAQFRTLSALSMWFLTLLLLTGLVVIALGALARQAWGLA